jgi:hypothetical protein
MQAIHLNIWSFQTLNQIFGIVPHHAAVRVVQGLKNLQKKQNEYLLVHLGSISPTFYLQLLRQQSCANSLAPVKYKPKT